MNTGARLLWTVVGFLFGILPASLLFLWISADCHLPIHGQPSSEKLFSKASYNIIIFLYWGFCHSFFAQESWNSFAINTLGIPKGAMRMVYYIITGCNTVLLLYLWKTSDIQLWSLPWLSHEQNLAVSVILFWLLMLPNAIHIRNLGLADFIGIGQLNQKDDKERSFGTAKLVTTGFYSQMRHPIYTFTLIAFSFTNSMSLDRAVLIAASILYLYFAIPVEEQKLIYLFGNAYREYQKRVPAVIPAFLLNLLKKQKRTPKKN